ncbi:winged helix-turn-helix transcriptional regulator [Cetobacterium sp.]|uniref:winged helix-turn-helix transcriptional regulator n=1 Tax=Cetobacterium sp. TaxID=2071632 RepID=UPI003F37DB7E
MTKKKSDYDNGLPDKNIYDSECPLIYTLNLVGQKWKLPILWYLFKNERTRYNELKRQVKGITNMMLAKSLKELEENHLIIRTQYPTIPPKVEYSLTDLAKELFPALNELYSWGERLLDKKNRPQ